MRAAIHNQYLDTLGGGERYTLTFALVLAKKGYSVDITWHDPSIQKLINNQIDASVKQKLEERFGMKLDGINFVDDIKRGDGYDLCFWVSDGSIPTLRSRKNFLHFQVPFHHIGGNSLLNKMKLFRVEKIICNSKFTKAVIDKEYGVEGIVIYPPVDVTKIKPKRKENIILSVGRFSELKQSKHQDVLVKAFKKLVDGGLTDWRLVLAGGAEVGATELITRLRKMSENYPIDIIESPDFSTLKDLYGKARIFWTASGFEENEVSSPEKVEHFGIVIVEAMSSGAVPMAFKAGGFKETIEDGVNGFLWETTSELMRKTKAVVNNPKSARQVVKKALEDSKLYSEERFEREVTEIL
jgi:glycosyltransferase involved in cell wall biosynthesis